MSAQKNGLPPTISTPSAAGLAFRGVLPHVRQTIQGEETRPLIGASTSNRLPVYDLSLEDQAAMQEAALIKTIAELPEGLTVSGHLLNLPILKQIQALLAQGNHQTLSVLKQHKALFEIHQADAFNNLPQLLSTLKHTFVHLPENVKQEMASYDSAALKKLEEIAAHISDSSSSQTSSSEILKGFETPPQNLKAYSETLVKLNAVFVEHVLTIALSEAELQPTTFNIIHSIAKANQQSQQTLQQSEHTLLEKIGKNTLCVGGGGLAATGVVGFYGGIFAFNPFVGAALYIGSAIASIPLTAAYANIETNQESRETKAKADNNINQHANYLAIHHLLCLLYEEMKQNLKPQKPQDMASLEKLAGFFLNV